MVKRIGEGEDDENVKVKKIDMKDIKIKKYMKREKKL